MVRVEFRLLQVILSPVSGDRVTVALLHWDRTTFRVASSTAALRALERDHREGLRVAIQDVVRSAERKTKEVSERPVLDIGLAHVLPVREGFGAALYWSPVTAVETADAEAHFAELRQELRLDANALTRGRRMTNAVVYEELSALGRKMQLEERVRPWVRTDYVVKLETTYQPPLSWKNARWHHAVPLSMDGLQPWQMDEAVQKAYGLVELSFPEREVAVLVPVLPRDAELLGTGRNELRILETKLGSRIAIVAPEWRAGKLALDPIVVRIRQDIAHVS